ncbi:CDP-diacylglycerol--serine O-phosphatidyltransferase [Mycobacterium bourgelatii]|uniref:CDP-diacylglycerol--serine O-phosphatidyltransferase n=1 Tax=Mycobacterium bourgelatii TaxID=1273442 RepID=A0A7I9YHX2_MYCBU|nr:CDP-diacylglycerol--serine O-phosphatidyltransferase [Mycobacterium bourgelatii]MCV6973324.1 CDP-diacylglycerol--serine O-phosphatidyltransferase [Mycobacterium bourgelatii]GFG88267.1 CDP-diacylglycerol--serine O-phosphatidyltransferase [Mycobacterium bourgelatii]
MIEKPRVRRTVNLHLLPSAMTVLSICAGLTSIKLALDGEPIPAMALIAIAAILDALDGRVARILDAQSRMGAEIDSLADTVNFGVAPALVVYVTLFNSPIGWMVVLLYAICVVLRLARYNAALDDGTLPPYAKEFFVGMPAPAGAVSMIGTIALKLEAKKLGFGDDGWWTNQWVLAAWIAGTSLLMVSAIPMKKVHTFAVPPNLAVLALAVVAIVAAAAVWQPYLLIWVIIISYVCHIPFAVRSKRWLAQHPEVWGEKPKQWRAAQRATRRAQPHRRSMARLGLRKPGGRP